MRTLVAGKSYPLIRGWRTPLKRHPNLLSSHNADSAPYVVFEAISILKVFKPGAGLS